MAASPVEAATTEHDKGEKSLGRTRRGGGGEGGGENSSMSPFWSVLLSAVLRKSKPDSIHDMEEDGLILATQHNTHLQLSEQLKLKSPIKIKNASAQGHTLILLHQPLQNSTLANTTANHTQHKHKHIPLKQKPILRPSWKKIFLTSAKPQHSPDHPLQPQDIQPSPSNQTSLSFKLDNNTKPNLHNPTLNQAHFTSYTTNTTTSTSTNTTTGTNTTINTFYQSKQHTSISQPNLPPQRANSNPVHLHQEEQHLQHSQSPYISSGHWGTIDTFLSFGLSRNHSHWRLSTKLYPVRKTAAHITGLHGLLSGKPKHTQSSSIKWFEPELEVMGERIRVHKEHPHDETKTTSDFIHDPDSSIITQTSFEQPSQSNNLRNRMGRIQRAFWSSPKDDSDLNDTNKRSVSTSATTSQTRQESIWEQERQKRDRVKEIDRLILSGQEELLRLQCEKDHLQQRPNPLYNYTMPAHHDHNDISSSQEQEPNATRVFNFPPQELVDEYIEELISSRRLIKMNHSHLWNHISSKYDDDDDEESIGDDLFTPSADAQKLYERQPTSSSHEDQDTIDSQLTSSGGRRRGNNRSKSNNGGGGGGGSWLLRQTIGSRTRIGEKIGEAAEMSAYKGVCSSLMSILAQSIAALHGVNLMTHSDVRLFVENAPDLPPLQRRRGMYYHSHYNAGTGDNDDGVTLEEEYAHEAIQRAIRRGATKRQKRKRKKSANQQHHQDGAGASEEASIQRDAVVETLISHCQISAPLLKLFPLAWQRALLGNIITLLAAVISDFCDGIQLQILGHALSFSFKPITESDLIQHIGDDTFLHLNNNRRVRPEEFEAAVRSTANDISDSFDFLDRWHERALGGGMLRAQLANLIARMVLTLADEVLSGARFDLWSAQAGGPRVVAGLEYRTNNNNEESDESDDSIL